MTEVGWSKAWHKDKCCQGAGLRPPAQRWIHHTLGYEQGGLIRLVDPLGLIHNYSYNAQIVIASAAKQSCFSRRVNSEIASLRSQ